MVAYTIVLAVGVTLCQYLGIASVNYVVRKLFLFLRLGSEAYALSVYPF